MLRADSSRQKRDFGRELCMGKVEERRKYEAQSVASDGRVLSLYSGCAEGELDEKSESFRKSERFKDSSAISSSSCGVNGVRPSDGLKALFVGILCAVRRSGKLFFPTMNFGRCLRRVLAYDVVRKCICSVSGSASKLLLVDNDVGEGISMLSASSRFSRTVLASLRCGAHSCLSEVWLPFISVLKDDSVMDKIDASESTEGDRACGVTPASNSL